MESNKLKAIEVFKKRGQNQQKARAIKRIVTSRPELSDSDSVWSADCYSLDSLESITCISSMNTVQRTLIDDFEDYH